MKRVKDSDERLVDVKVIFKNGDERELTLDYFPNEINDIMGYIEYHYLIERIDKVIVKTGGQYWETIYENGHQITDSRKIKDSNIAYSVLDENDRLLDEFTSKEKAIAYAEKNNKADGVVRFKYSEDGDVLDAKEIWTKNKSVSDSKKIKDADDAPDVLDGILMIAFNDGSEEEGYNEVKSHANEQGEIDGVKYETYDSDYQDGVTLIDLCALTDDANAFVKALLKEWGVIDEVADIEFEASDNMKGEVSDSYRVSDMTKPIHLRGYAEKYRKKRREQKENLGRVESIDDLEENMDYGQGIYDSNRVSDMTKPAHLRGYAEKYRKKRREQKELNKENEEEKQEVNDSRKIKDSGFNAKEIKSVIDELNTLSDLSSSNLIEDDYVMGQGEIVDILDMIEENRSGLAYSLENVLDEYEQYEDGYASDWVGYYKQAKNFFKSFEEYCNNYVKNTAGKGWSYFDAIDDAREVLKKLDSLL